MAKLTPTARSKLSKKHFGVPEKAPGPGSYPMPDKEHAVVAEGLAAMHGSAEESRIRAKAHRLFPGLK